MNERRTNIVTLKFAQTLGYCLKRTMHICFHNHVQRRYFARLNMGEDIFKFHSALNSGVTALVHRAISLLTRAGHGSCSSLIRGRPKFFTCTWHHRQTEYLHRRRRPCLFDLLSTVVDQCANLTPRGTRDYWVTYFEYTFVDQNCRHRATTNI